MPCLGASQAAVKGIERAQLRGADPHKWLYVPYDAGAALVRDAAGCPTPSARFRSISQRLRQRLYGAGLFRGTRRGAARGFKALKVGGAEADGPRGYAAAIDRDVALAQLLSRRAGPAPGFERLSETVLSIVNFRYRPPGVSRPDLDR